MDESYVPTYAGTMTLDLSDGDTGWQCDYQAACTSPAGIAPPPNGAAYPNAPETIMARTGWSHQGYLWDTWPDSQTTFQEKDTLFFEQGHVIDFAETTDAERQEFLSLWHMPQTVAEWGDGEAQLNSAPGTSPPMDQFALAYSACAMFPVITTNNAALALDDAQIHYPGLWIPAYSFNKVAIRQALATERETCSLFRQIAASYGT
ncbi:MAG TPA: hypothetical protein VIJ50_03785 [Solirubrobacteraceae bacterium]